MKPVGDARNTRRWKSLPIWERGLKLDLFWGGSSSSVPSLPIWERGLKQKWTGSWWCRRPGRSPIWERGLKLKPNLQHFRPALSSLPIWERGLKLNKKRLYQAEKSRRSLYGSVDLKHMMEDGMDDYDMVAPYMGAWIENTYSSWLAPEDNCVAPYMGAWIETPSNKARCPLLYGRSLYGSVD